MLTFQKSLRGRVIQPGDADYDEARALYNGLIDKRYERLATVKAKYDPRNLFRVNQNIAPAED